MASPDPRLNRGRRRPTVASLILGSVMVAILALAVTLAIVLVDRALHPKTEVNPYAGQSGTTASTSTTVAEGGGGDESTSTTLGGALLRPQAATSSSYLKATMVDDFRAPNMVDQDFATCWSEGVPGEGIGEWVKFEFEETVKLVRIDVANGDQRADERFTSGIRIKTILLEYSDGSEQLVDLLDARALQSINAKAVDTDWLKITIMAVHPDHTRADASMTEVRLYGMAASQQ